MPFRRTSEGRVLSINKKFVEGKLLSRKMSEAHANIYAEMDEIHAGQIINVNRKHKDNSLILQTIPISATPLNNEENADKIDILYCNLYEEAIKILNHNIEVILVANQLCKLFKPFKIDTKNEQYVPIRLSLKDVEVVSAKLKKLNWLQEDVEIPLNDVEDFLISVIHDKLNSLQYSYDESQRNYRRAKINYGKGQSLNPINSTLINILNQSKDIINNIESLFHFDKFERISSALQNRYNQLSNKKQITFIRADAIIQLLNDNKIDISNLLKIDNDYIHEISKVEL